MRSAVLAPAGLVLVALATTAGLAGLIGCAVGTDVVTTDDDLAAYPLDSGDDEDGSAKLPPPSIAPEEDAGDDDTDGGDEDDAGADAGTDGGTDGGTGPGTGACAAPNTCQGATDLGTVSGDTGAATQNAQGSTSQWFTVRVSEDDSSVIATSLRMKATLTSPPGLNFDLYVYVPGSDVRECTTVTKSSKNTTASDTASVEFGESGVLSNGSDDDRTVTLEVRYVSGTCSTNSKWLLAVTGNTN